MSKVKTVYELLLKYKQRYMECARRFVAIFGKPLKHFYRFDSGFDVVEFDKFLGVPDGVSTREFLADRYGDEAVRLIEKLIDVR